MYLTGWVGQCYGYRGLVGDCGDLEGGFSGAVA
jgi:hypothetical protein